MAKQKNQKAPTPEVVEVDDQPETINVRNSLANPPSQTGLNGYEYTHRTEADVKDPNRRDGLGE